MKSESNPVTTTGTIDKSNTRKLGIKASKMGRMMSMLSDMYTNSYDAVIREYAANGFDSHIAAGNPAPVEVTLPTALQPSLLIQDKGVGLSLDSLLNVYGEYLESTKEDTDEEVGGFGIGAKSAFTLGQQFIVTGVKDGLKNVVLFSLDSDGAPEVTVLSENLPTDEDNGVLVSLAVEDVERMQESAVRVFSTWPRGSVLVDGEEPTPVYERGTEVNDVVTMVSDHDGSTLVASGPVAYEVTREMWRQVSKRLSEDDEAGRSVCDTLVNWGNVGTDTTIYFRIGIGEVSIHPSRERLRDTRKTLDVLTALVSTLGADLVQSIQDKVDAAPSPYRAALISREEREGREPFKIPAKSIKFNGVTKIHGDVKVDLPNVHLGTKNYRSTTKIVKVHEFFNVTLDNADKVLVITGLADSDQGKVTRYAKRFLENSTKYEHILLAAGTAASYKWFQYGVQGGVDTMTLEEYRAHMKTLRAQVVRVVNEPSYSTGLVRAERDIEERDTLTEILAEGKDIIVQWESAQAYRNYADLFTDYTVVVLLPTQSEDALRKRVEVDGSVKVLDVTLRSIVAEHCQAIIDTVTEAEVEALSAAKWLRDNGNPLSSWSNYITSLGEGIFDGTTRYQDAVDTVEIVGLLAEGISPERQAEIRLARTYASLEVPDLEVDKITVVSEVYPMLAQVGNYYLRHDQALRDDVIAYIKSKG